MYLRDIIILRRVFLIKLKKMNPHKLLLLIMISRTTNPTANVTILIKETIARRYTSMVIGTPKHCQTTRSRCASMPSKNKVNPCDVSPIPKYLDDNTCKMFGRFSIFITFVHANDGLNVKYNKIMVAIDIPNTVTQESDKYNVLVLCDDVV